MTTRRLLVLLATQVLLWALVSGLNHELVRLRLFLFEGGLFVAYGALFLPFGTGLAAAFIAGLVCDAHSAVPFGTHALLFAAAQAVLFRLRDRMPHDTPAGLLAVVLLANAALFLALSVLEVHGGPFAMRRWGRLVSDLVGSQLALALIAPWFLALQAKALVLARAESTRQS